MKVDHVACGEPANDSERTAIRYLREKIEPLGNDQRWILLSNVPIAVHERAIPLEIDLIAIGNTGIYPIEIKHWDDRFLREHKPIAESESDKFTEKVRILASKIRKVRDPGFLKGRFLLTKSATGSYRNLSFVNGLEFFGLVDWRAVLEIDQPNQFSNSEVDQICKLIVPNSKVTLEGKIRTLANIRNLELQSPVESRFHRVFRGEHTRTRIRVIMHLYDLSASTHPHPLELARREAEAIRKLGRTLKCVPEIVDTFQPVSEYPGELFYFTLTDPSAPSLESRAGDSRWNFDERCRFAINAMNALQSLHSTPMGSTSFVHRKISPRSLLVTVKNEALFTELDMARITDTTTVSPPSADLERQVWQSPEVAQFGIGAADQRSDVYSLCSCLKLIFACEQSDRRELICKILDEGLCDQNSDRKPLSWLILQIERVTGNAECIEHQLPTPEFWSDGILIPFKGSKYKILTRLGKGAFGAVFKVQEIGPDGVAYGIFTAKALFNYASSAIVIPAYRAVRSFTDRPNLATIFETTDVDHPEPIAALMKFVPGTPLRDWIGLFPLLAEDREMSVLELATHWLVSMCDALRPLHAAGFVHGDVSPGNIIESDGQVVLIDYDLLQRSEEPAWNPGTIEYAAPERIDGQNTAFSQDIFSLAATMFHVIFDRPPFLFEGERSNNRGLNWGDTQTDGWGWLPRFFDKATSPDERERFSDAASAFTWIDGVENSRCKLDEDLELLRQNTIDTPEMPETQLSPLAEGLDYVAELSSGCRVSNENLFVEMLKVLQSLNTENSNNLHDTSAGGLTLSSVDNRSAADDVSEQVWFALAAWAKNNNQFTGWERHFIFSVGKRVQLKGAATERQLEIAAPILNHARTIGFPG